MRSQILSLATLAGLALASPKPPRQGTPWNPVLIPSCGTGKPATITYDESVPDRRDFYRTDVRLCYTRAALEITFEAHDEPTFYFDPEHTTNDDIWTYNVMEAFIHRGTSDPQTYLEFEVSPNNVTYQALVYNPSKTRAAGAPFDHLFVGDPAGDGFRAETELDRAVGRWTSRAVIPLGLFNVDEGEGRGTRWRMQFLRTVTSEETFPAQELGAWNPQDEANFHITKRFGHLRFV